ncbi:four-carbon acid sugar kinase family protein [Paenibacillus sedimenti]|uniref:Four-carbon acid sugar kinase family protein n=1 Tax=Paenibacillus sedimenti TaxID=2770274 RepID=A0A926KJ51_9BACL|nr:four-carbon acid sugar kinase family protein [Paenibacillus sedimenti]MBD0378679.1 four-carbon acid sugar kinase family protein [Paenibacillus sedimenti]
MRICYYGDDFTGSTDALEALTTGGLRVILFMDIPDMALWKEKFAGYDGFGVAGVSRTMSPEDMERALRPVLTALRTFKAPITHYKICSTFDSSPETGSIGKVIEIGREVFPEQRFTPLLAGSPILKRYTVFGNHFTAEGTDTVRLDRHPNMRKHPVTPMNEADLRVHLAEQTSCSIGLMNVLDLEQNGTMLEWRFNERLDNEPDILLFDVLTDDHLTKIGGLLEQESDKAPLFVVGSSGVEYAFVSHWRRSGLLPEASSTPRMQAEPTDRVLVVSGSCSPATEAQIEWALAHGYAGIRVPASIFFEDATDTTLPSLLQEADRMLQAGKNVILYTALGPHDESIEQTQNRLRTRGLSLAASGELIGGRLGEMARELVLSAGLKRVIFAGGDTSGFAVKRLNLYALEMIAPIVSGGPLCRAYSNDERIDGLQVVLKGGQVGPPDFFDRVRRGIS